MLSCTTSQMCNATYTGLTSGTIQYQYFVRCNGSSIQIACVSASLNNYNQGIDPVTGCLCPPSGIGYHFNGTVDGSTPADDAAFLDATTSCDPPTATLNWPRIWGATRECDVCPDVGGDTHRIFDLTPPSASVTVTFDVEIPSNQVCCQPCPIPKKNLIWTGVSVLYGAGTCTLTWDTITSRWTGTFSFTVGLTTTTLYITLACISYIHLNIFSPPGMETGCDCTLSSYTCSPLHLDYTMVAGDPLGCDFLIDTGYTHFYIDE